MALPVKHTGKPALPCLCTDCYMSDRIVLHHQLLYCKTIEKGQEKTAGTLVRNLICSKNRSTETKIVTFRTNSMNLLEMEDTGLWAFLSPPQKTEEKTKGKYCLRTERCLWKIERTSKRFFSISWTVGKVWKYSAQSQLPGTNISGGFNLLACGGSWDVPITNTQLPSSSFSVTCTAWCWGTVLSVLSGAVYIFMLHPLTSYPSDDIPHRTQKWINVKKVIMWALAEGFFPPESS